MSDQDDRPESGRGPSDDSWDDEPVASDGDWDDEPAPRSRRAKPADDDWDDDWDDDDRPKRDLTLVYAVVAAAIVIVLAIVLTNGNDDQGSDTQTTAAATASPDATEPAQPNKVWQGPVGEELGDAGSQMEERATSGPGIYLWTDFCGWHVRNNGDAEIAVTITGPKVRVRAEEGVLGDGECQGDEGSAEFGTEASFTVAPGDGSTGEGFDVSDSETVTVEITRDGQPVPPAEIKLGGGDGVASENPVTFTKA